MNVHTQFGAIVILEHALLEVGHLREARSRRSAPRRVKLGKARTHLVEAIHVALTNEAAKVGMLEEAWEYLSSEAVRRGDCSRASRGA